MHRSLAVAAFALSGLARTPLAAGNASSGGWYEQKTTCGDLESLCGDGCTVDLGYCRDGQCFTLMDDPVECAPAVMGCDEDDKKTIDGGCCPELTFPAGPGSCVAMSCESELQYNCGSDTSVAPVCAEEPTAPPELGANITGTVTRCSRGSAVCYTLDEQPFPGSWEWVYIDDSIMHLASGCDPAGHTVSGSISSHGLAAPLLGLLLPAAGLLPAA